MAKWRSPKKIRDGFFGWQCRIRQIAMRQAGGRPSPGMRPRVLDGSGRELSSALTVLIIPRDPAESTDFFRFQVLKTADPRDLYERALGYLQADYFQRPVRFSDLLTAAFPAQSELAASLVTDGKCVLEFDQFSQRYRLPCAVFEAETGEVIREATSQPVPLEGSLPIIGPMLSSSRNAVNGHEISFPAGKTSAPVLCYQAQILCAQHLDSTDQTGPDWF